MGRFFYNVTSDISYHEIEHCLFRQLEFTQ